MNKCLHIKTEKVVDQINNPPLVETGIERCRICGAIRTYLTNRNTSGMILSATTHGPWEEPTIDSEVTQLAELLRHCATRAGYQHCGYEEMTDEQKILFNSITGWSTKTQEQQNADAV